MNVTPIKDKGNNYSLRKSFWLASVHWDIKLMCSIIDFPSSPENIVKSGLLKSLGNWTPSTHCRYDFLYTGLTKGLNCTPKYLLIVSAIIFRSISWGIAPLSLTYGWGCMGATCRLAPYSIPWQPVLRLYIGWRINQLWRWVYWLWGIHWWWCIHRLEWSCRLSRISLNRLNIGPWIVNILLHISLRPISLNY